MPTLALPGLFPHQQAVADHPAPRKLLPWGRRAGKSRFDLSAAVEGHGPVTNGQPLHRGLLQNRDVLWVGRSVKQAGIIWTEEVKPRFSRAGAYTNDTQMVAQLYGFGRLIVCSQDADSIANARGMGARVAGVICDEAAHWDDAENVWKQILVPMLLDNEGWAVFSSTTHAGSWFNQQCDRFDAGGLGEDWMLWEATALQNPIISPAAFDKMVAEYSPEDPRLQEEVYAKRLAGGTGLAFPEWNNAVHRLSLTARVPETWRWVAGMDYGYRNGGYVGLFACGPDDELWLMWELRFVEMSLEEIGRTLGELMPQYGRLPEWIACDSAMWDTGPTIPEGIQKALNETLGSAHVSLVSTPKGRHSRLTSKALCHEALKYERDKHGNPLPWAPPNLRVHPRCTYFLATVPSLPRDEKNSEDVDTTADDHAYDAWRYMLMCRQPKAGRDVVVVPENVHPGFRPDGTRRPRVQTAETEAEELAMVLQRQGVTIGGRYGGRP